MVRVHPAVPAKFAERRIISLRRSPPHHVRAHLTRPWSSIRLAGKEKCSAIMRCLVCGERDVQGSWRLRRGRRGFIRHRFSCSRCFERAGRRSISRARPVTMVVPFAAGGPTDILGRLIGQRPSVLRSDSRVVVEDVTGAGGTIGAAKVARAIARRLHHGHGQSRYARGKRRHL